MMAGALLALFWALIAAVGVACALAFVKGAGWRA